MMDVYLTLSLLLAPTIRAVDELADNSSKLFETNQSDSSCFVPSAL